MAGGQDGYSRFVRIVRILLPAVALTILVGLFVISKRIDLNEARRGLDINRLISEQGIGSPSFRGTTPDGAIVTLRATRAVPSATSPGAFNATEVAFSVKDKNGLQITLDAAEAYIPAGGELATLSGGVKLAVSTGIRLETEELWAAPDFTSMGTPGKLMAEAPFGTIEAGAMQMTSELAENGERSYRLVFEQGVKLVYMPVTE